MKKQKIRSRKLSIQRETVKQLNQDQLHDAAGGFTGDCSWHPSHRDCSFQLCTFSCI